MFQFKITSKYFLSILQCYTARADQEAAVSSAGYFLIPSRTISRKGRAPHSVCIVLAKVCSYQLPKPSYCLGLRMLQVATGISQSETNVLLQKNLLKRQNFSAVQSIYKNIQLQTTSLFHWLKYSILNRTNLQFIHQEC